MIVVFIGLPGTGKTTTAKILVENRGFLLLNRDHIRDSIFPPSTIDYTHEQNELASDVSYQVGEYILKKQKNSNLCFDGRPFSKPVQIEPIRHMAVRFGVELKVIKCVAPDDVVIARLEEDNKDVSIAAAGRNKEKYLRIKNVFQDPEIPFLTLDTSQPIAMIEATLLKYIDR